MTDTVEKTTNLLRLLQLSDSALPIGSYSHSWGLETFVQEGLITNFAQAAEAIQNIMHFSFAPREGVAAAIAYKVQKNQDSINNFSPTKINDYLTASLWTEETWTASINMGQRLWRLADSLGWCRGEGGLFIKDGAQCHHCVAVGTLAAILDIDLEDLIPAYLFTGTTAMVAALVKLVPLGHTDGQKLLSQTQPLIATLSATCINAAVEDVGGFAPINEWASLQHQFLYSRLFQS